MRLPGPRLDETSFSRDGVMGGLLFIAVIIAWFGFCAWLARKIARWIPIESTLAKSVIGVLAFSLFFPLPLIDEIIGKFQFDKLCREEAGVKIFGKLELGPEFFNADGTPNFFTGNNWFGIDKRMNEIVALETAPSEKFESLVRLDKTRLLIKSRLNNSNLAMITSFVNGGGWLSYDHQPWIGRSECYSVETPRDALKKIIVNR